MDPLVMALLVAFVAGMLQGFYREYVLGIIPKLMTCFGLLLSALAYVYFGGESLLQFIWVLAMYYLSWVLGAIAWAIHNR